MPEDLKQSLFKVIELLEQYLRDIVLGGGWASFAVYDRSKDSIEVQPGIWAQTLEYIRISTEHRIPFMIDIGDKRVNVFVPKPAAFILNKGLVFTRRKDEIKKAKDLYYIFDILAYRDKNKIEGKLAKDLIEIAGEYSSNWFKTFRDNLNNYFVKDTQNGINMVFGQRPNNAYLEYNDNQFKNYIKYIFGSFIEEIESNFSGV